jgi:hypothetical protein
MRRATPLALLFVCGCIGPGMMQPDGAVTSFKLVAGPAGADAVGLEIAVIEVPLGDRYVNADLLATIDEQVVELDRKAALEDNGFRVGLIGGVWPSQFDELLKSQRSDPDRRWVQMRTGHPRVVTLGGPRPVCKFQIITDGKPTSDTAIEKGRCALQITPTLADDGGVKLAFVPQIQHGTRPVWLAPLTGDELAIPAESYPALGWEVTAAPGEFVIVGTQFAKADTLGHTIFVDTDGVKPVQRLLAIRAVRPGAN